MPIIDAAREKTLLELMEVNEKLIRQNAKLRTDLSALRLALHEAGAQLGMPNIHDACAIAARTISKALNSK